MESGARNPIGFRDPFLVHTFNQYIVYIALMNKHSSLLCDDHDVPIRKQKHTPI